jgi:hypothetical protein
LGGKKRIKQAHMDWLKQEGPRVIKRERNKLGEGGGKSKEMILARKTKTNQIQSINSCNSIANDI